MVKQHKLEIRGRMKQAVGLIDLLKFSRVKLRRVDAVVREERKFYTIFQQLRAIGISTLFIKFVCNVIVKTVCSIVLKKS